MSGTPPTDAEIISASLVDATDFEIIVDRHFNAVFAFVARRVGRQDAQDVASEVFLRAFALRHRYDRSRSDCLPWLYGIAKNVVRNWLSKIVRSQRIYLAAYPETVLRPYEEADNRLVAVSVSEELNDALRRLSARDRETLFLYALEDLSYKEIAEALHIPIGTVASRIARIRQRVIELIPDLEAKTRLMVDIRDEETTDGA
ncbi:MAG TPA: RNA polymerase sigma factor [Acidimicrobiia bacterium]|nr:RNA polymerase sigma factor [Acidimicrobiia bacterium]